MNSQKSLKIPQQLRLFSNSTALICVSHDRAKVYQVNQDSLEEVSDLHTSDTDYRYSDQEAFSHAEGVSTVFFKPGTEAHNKEHYLRVFLNSFSDQLKKLDREFHFHDVYLFLPDDLRYVAVEKLPTRLQKKVHVVIGNVAHEHPLELLRRIEKLTEEL
ncbi:MAG: hypothetical protein AB7J40_05695 [Candidatus Altimarinota bacterium]